MKMKDKGWWLRSSLEVFVFTLALGFGMGAKVESKELEGQAGLPDKGSVRIISY